MSQLIAAAKAIAHVVHAGQVDKAGNDYIAHPAAVAELLEDWGEEYVAAGWLHDVIEDCKGYQLYASNLIAAGISDEVADAVQDLSRNWNDGQDYYARVGKSQIGVVVKVADIVHNSDPVRLSALDWKVQQRLRAKYAKAMLELENSPAFKIQFLGQGCSRSLVNMAFNQLNLWESDGSEADSDGGDAEQWQSAWVSDADSADSRNKHDSSL